MSYTEDKRGRASIQANWFEYEVVITIVTSGYFLLRDYHELKPKCVSLIESYKME